MTVRMTFPPFVTRAAMRIALGGLVAAAAIAVAALVIERTAAGRRPGGVARPAQGRGGRRVRRADRAARPGRARRDARCRDAAPRRARRCRRRTRQLFDQVAASAARTRRRGHDLRRRQPAGRLARAFRGRARRPALRPGVVVPGAEQPGPAAGSRRSRSSIRPSRRVTSARSSPKRSCRGPAAAAAGLGVLARDQHCAGRAAAAVRRRVGCRPRRVRHSLADRTSRWRRSSCPTRTCSARGSAFAIACIAAELALAGAAAAAAGGTAARLAAADAIRRRGHGPHARDRRCC